MREKRGAKNGKRTEMINFKFAKRNEIWSKILYIFRDLQCGFDRGTLSAPQHTDEPV